MKPQTSKEFVEEIMAYENEYAELNSHHEKNRQALLDMLNTAANKPSQPINEEAQAVIRALESLKTNLGKPKITAATFDYKTYLQTDAQAKEIFTKYITSKGYSITIDEETYGVDIIASKNNNKALFELEMSSQQFICAETFNYENVHFLARKKKMLDKEGDYHYIILNAAGTYAMTAMASKIFKEENKITKWAGNGRDGLDEFYQLPKNEVKFFKIKLT
jgi:hypothetical protein